MPRKASRQAPRNPLEEPARRRRRERDTAPAAAPEPRPTDAAYERIAAALEAIAASLPGATASRKVRQSACAAPKRSSGILPAA